MIAPTFTTWRKSSYSGDQGNCIEVAFAGWHKSSHSGDQSNCVEVAHALARAGIRDTKDRDGGTLVVPTAAWHAFLATR